MFHRIFDGAGVAVDEAAVAINWAAECRLALPDLVKSRTDVAASTADVGTAPVVLITGGTGFLGPYRLVVQTFS